MSFTVVKDNKVTVVTVVADQKSILPPLCQILKTLCYSPTCCSVDKGLMQTSVTAGLGTVQIMVGLFNIGLGPGRTYIQPQDLPHLAAAYWLGAAFIIAGITTLVAGQFPSLCLVVFAVLMNIIGAIFAIIGIVLYGKDIAETSVYSMCLAWFIKLYHVRDNCGDVAAIAQYLLGAVDIALIVMAVLQLCVCISFAALGIKALINRKKEEGDVEGQQTQLKDVLLTSPGA
ncbi:uncharacterized protein LOC121945940 [Plectropomus leopardus]|uniref:uncharacterized protein LOC121945940 n=1 Tax=Plectropomus leopardus TaxID=160734 RepID=UPI001C4ABF1A|nr:uncharacterized protein LOC121945940 [Plectropomus leopardus]